MFNPEEWLKLATDIYKAICQEFEIVESSDSIMQAYPKLIVMYEFFRLIRGEAFSKIHEPVASRQLYDMENEILSKLQAINKKIDLKDERVQFYLEEMRKSFQ